MGDQLPTTNILVVKVLFMLGAAMFVCDDGLEPRVWTDYIMQDSRQVGKWAAEWRAAFS
jgi:hypothetical protein